MVRFGMYPEHSVAGLGREAIDSVLRDADVHADKVQAVYAGRSFGVVLDGQISVPGQAALHGSMLPMQRYRPPLESFDLTTGFSAK